MDAATADPERETIVRVELGTEAHPVLIGWCLWNAQDPSGGQHSYAIVTGAGPILVDPNAPTGAAAGRLWGLLGRPPVATVLTSDFHERDAYRLRERWRTPVWGPAAGLPERGGAFDGRPDQAFEDGAALPGGLRAIKIDGGWIRGETVLAWRAPGGTRVLFTGDLLNGQSNPEHPQPYEWRRAPGLYAGVRNRYFVRNPERMPDPRTLQAGLRRLLTEEVDLVCGGHGLPYGGPAGGHAAVALARLLAMDWSPFLAAGGVPGVPAPPATAGPASTPPATDDTLPPAGNELPNDGCSRDIPGSYIIKRRESAWSERRAPQCRADGSGGSGGDSRGSG